MTISAVILSFNAANDLDRCVRSLIEVERLKAGLDQVIIIDNGSIDGSPDVIERLISTYPDLVEATFLPTNGGTTAPRNLGFAKATGDHVLVIDSDLHFRTSVLPPLLDQLNADPSIGIIAPRLVFPNGRRQMSTDVFPTISRKIERFFRLRALEDEVGNQDDQSQDDRGLRDQGAIDRGRDVDYAISAFWLMRRELIELLGPLDERIFYAPEDADYCLRSWLFRRRVVYRPDLNVVHDAKERSRSFKNWQFTRRHVQGLAYFFRKHGYAISTERLYRRIGRSRLLNAAQVRFVGRTAESGVSR